MITRTAIHFNDDDTAWYVEVASQMIADSFKETLDRPCDTCGKEPTTWLPGFVLSGDDWVRCPARCINGRHTFTVDVEVGNMRWDHIPSPPRTLRVSVVPGMVLPITDHFIGGPHIRLRNGRAVYVETNERQHPITLPPDAKVGGYAVKVQVHQ